jgi:site-specific DNA recombinase
MKRKVDVSAVAAVYARKSNDEPGKDADAKSVTRQVEHAKAYAKRKGWHVEDRFVYSDDGISGVEFKHRPGLTRLRAALSSPGFSILIVSEQSRLGRDTLRTLEVIRDLEDAGVQIYSYLDDRRLSLADSMGEVSQFMQSWAGAEERRKASQRARDTAMKLARAGKSTGQWPFGYKAGEIVPAQARVVRRIFTRRAAGKGYHKIARELEADHIPAPRGGEFWDASLISAILRNEKYRGVIVWGRTRQDTRRGTTHTVKGSPADVIRTDVPDLRIIDDTLWQAAQAINTKNGDAKASRATAGRYLLTPFLACGACGSPMTVRKKGRGTPQPVYFCMRRHLRGKKACKNARGLPMATADKALMTAFETALAGGLVVSALQEWMAAQPAHDPKPLKAQAARIKAEIDRLIAALAQGSGMADEVNKAVVERKATLKQIEAEVSRANGGGFDIKAFVRKVTPMLEQWRSHLRDNPDKAQPVLRRILPHRLKVTPTPTGGWKFSGLTDYSAVLRELGLEPVQAMLEAASSKLSPKQPPPRWPRWRRRSG